MASIFDKLYSKNLLHTPPAFLKNNIHYEVMTGSVAYGCNTNYSDIDIYGFGIPAKDIVFPHTSGYIPEFDTDIPKFKQFEQHHIVDKEADKEYDISIYNIVQFFKLTMQNNPNLVDVLFVPRRCVLFSTQIGEHVRSHRKDFLHKGAFHKFRGYASSQLHKMKSKAAVDWVKLCKEHDWDLYISAEELRILFDPNTTTLTNALKLIKQIETSGNRTKRLSSIAEHGFDVKFAFHIIRLLSECEQILETGDLDIQRDREIYKAIRRGDWTKEQIVDHFERHDRSLKKLYDTSTLQHSPDVNKIRNLLLECLEMHFGNLDAAISSMNKHEMAIRDIKMIVDKL